MTNGVTQAAIGAIGEDDPKADWILQPQEHAGGLPPEAGPLARVLRADAIRQIMTRYDEFDARANAAQAVYKKRSRQAIRARLIAILIGGLFLLPIAGAGLAGAVAVKAALAVQYVCLAAALGLAAYISVGRLFKRWMEARAEVELARLALFDQVMEAREEAQTGELPLLPLKLEYVRRY
jgi:hypothetical protein